MAGDANGWVPMLVAVDTLSLLDDLVSEMDSVDSKQFRIVLHIK